MKVELTLESLTTDRFKTLRRNEPAGVRGPGDSRLEVQL